jgi:hypothetical protein
MTLADRTRAIRAIATCALSLLVTGPALTASPKPDLREETIAIEDLLKSGWQVAGFTSTFDNRSAMILFRHPTETTLVQCLTGYDVTRTPRTYTNCYRLR